MRATVLFARRGYASVSIRDLADDIGLRPASIYNHFVSKEALFEDVLSHVEELYMMYFHYIERRLDECADAGEVFALLLEEPKRMRNDYTTYGFSLVFCEQFSNATAWRITNEIFYKLSVDRICAALERVNFNGDANIAAGILMELTFFVVRMSAHQLMGREISFSQADYLACLEKFLSDAGKP
jgi:AcrR family transcriptional regulator